ncbi:MAG: hypothetical protein K8R53_15905, partial [Bacteroidales bacterium]|nr:hypothetical protein [Bacteroidales bacterium]
PSGAAVYTIPLEVPPGTAGMEPQLAFVYNSQGTDGLMGHGWSVAGLSNIAHAPLTYYYNGRPGQIDFEVGIDQRQLLLDGKKLICTDGFESTKSTYPVDFRSEEDNIEQIKYYPTGEYFIVKTKSGLTKEYGRTLNSKQYLGNNLFSWHINKICDQFGNYIKYEYFKDAYTGELWISRIDYTGNDNQNLIPYIAIEFEYKDRELKSYQELFFRGQDDNPAIYTLTKLLESVNIIHNNSKVSSYSLEYGSGGTFSDSLYIRKINRSVNNQSLNPTIFDWEYNTNSITTSTGYNYQSQNLNSGNAYICKGDFNGDGAQDIIEGNFPDGTKLNLKISNKNGNLVQVLEIFPQNSLVSGMNFYSGDFDGDGTSEILIEDNDINLIDIFYDPASQTYSYTEHLDIFGKSGELLIADFDGDGIDDCMLIEDSEASTGYLYTGDENINTFLSNPYVGQFTFDGNFINTGDFDGDGKQEVAVSSTTNTVDVYGLNPANSYIVLKYTFQHPDEWLYFWPGDFNGDNKTDLFVPVPDLNNPGNYFERIYYSFGNGFISTPVTGFDWQNGNYYVIVDHNGDNRDDIARYRYSYTPQLELDISVCQMGKNGRSFTPYLIPSQIYSYDDYFIDLKFGDFTGNGKDDIFYALKYFHEDPQNPQPPDYKGFFIFSTNSNIDRITKISDGLESDINVSYQSILRYSGYSHGSATSFPISKFKSPFYVVSEVERDNGFGGLYPPVNYYYKGAKTHRQGKGFLGFNEFIVKDKISNIYIRNKYDYYSVNDPGNQPEKLYFYPYVDTIEKRILLQNGSPGKFVSRAINSVAHINTISGNSLIFYPYIAETVLEEFEIDQANSLVKVTRRQQQNVDIYGNVHSSVIEKGTSGNQLNYIQTVTHTFWDDPDKWVLGRMEEATVIKSSPQNKSADKSSIFEYFQDTSSVYYGMLKSEILEPADTNALMKMYEYDGFGNILSSTLKPADTAINLLPRKSTTQYDPQTSRFVIEKTNPLNQSETKQYGPVWGNILSSCDINDLCTEFVYNDFGRLEKSILADETQKQSVLRWVQAGDEDAPLNALYYSWKQSSGKIFMKTYFNKTGKELRKIISGYDGRLIYQDNQYDPNTGLLVNMSDPFFKGDAPAWTTIVHDDLQRISSKTLPGNRLFTYSYSGLETSVTNPENQTNRVEVNPEGFKVEATDDNNRTVKYAYNNNGELTETWIDGFEPETKISLSYDVFGQVTSKTEPGKGTVGFVYNPFGELIESSQNGISEFRNPVYDQLGRLVSVSEPGFGDISYVYDNGWDGKTDSVKFTDSYGNLVSESFEYDNMGRLISQDMNINYNGFVDHLSTKNTYDVFGRLRNIIYPSGFTVTQKYNEAGYLTQIVRIPDEKVLYQVEEMNARLQIEQVLYGNDITTTNQYYDETGFLEGIHSVHNGKPSGSVVQNFTYGWNNVGNLMWRQKQVGIVDLREDFLYDNLNRLTTTNLNNGQAITQLSYDPLGRILSKTSADPTFHVADNFYYNDPQNPYALTGIDNQPITYLNENQSIDYTPFEKIRQILQGANNLDIVYNAAHNRVYQVLKDSVGNVKSRRIHFGNFYEKVIENNQVKEIHYIQSGKGLIAIYTKEGNGQDQFVYVHHDHLGSVQCLTDESGNITAEYSYDAWGSRRSPATWILLLPAGEQLINKGFCGHEHLDLFGIINMGGRVYDPLLAYFLSPDPMNGIPSHTQDFNPYIYCLNNPLALVDPSGYSWLSDNWKALGSAIIGITVSTLTAGTLTPVVAGLLGGFSGSFIGTLLNGGNFYEAYQAGFTGGIIGGLSAGFSYGIGEAFVGCSGVISEVARVLTHGGAQGYISTIEGGKFEHGFINGIAGAVSGMLSSQLVSSLKFFDTKSGYVLMAAALGGTVSVLGGGKFANGAITSAYTSLFNDYMHKRIPTRGADDPPKTALEKEKTEQELIREKFIDDGYSFMGDEEAKKFIADFYKENKIISFLKEVSPKPVAYFIDLYQLIRKAQNEYAKSILKTYNESGEGMGIFYKQ